MKFLFTKAIYHYATMWECLRQWRTKERDFSNLVKIELQHVFEVAQIDTYSWGWQSWNFVAPTFQFPKWKKIRHVSCQHKFHTSENVFFRFWKCQRYFTFPTSRRKVPTLCITYIYVYMNNFAYSPVFVINPLKSGLHYSQMTQTDFNIKQTN